MTDRLRPVSVVISLLLIMILYFDPFALSVHAAGKKRVAIIDTGSNIADESYTVIGYRTYDENGHGTSTARYLLENTDNAYIISVKAVDSDGFGNVSDISRALEIAIEHDAEIILMPLSFYDDGSYKDFRNKIEALINNGVTVIVSAGNNNSDASLYMPANIPGVITVGSVDSDGNKHVNSNYGNVVDYYVPSVTTSEACAVFAGKFIEGQIEDIATECTITEISQIEYHYEQNVYNADLKALGRGSYLFVTKEQMRAAGYSNSDAFRSAVISSCKKMNGAQYDMDHEYPEGGSGEGEPVDCITYANIAYANALGKIRDLATNENDLVTFSGSCMDSGPWHLYTNTGATGCTSWLYLRGIITATDDKKVASMGAPISTSLKKLDCKKGDLVFFGGWTEGKFKWLHAAIYDGKGKMFWQSRSKNRYTGRSERPEVTVNASSYTSILVLHIEDFDEFTGPDEFNCLTVKQYNAYKWGKSHGNKYCKDSKGNKITGLARIGKKIYLFDDDGVMLKGWQEFKGKTVYLSSSGVMQTGWKTIDGSKYYFSSDGVLQRSKVVDGVYLGTGGKAVV